MFQELYSVLWLLHLTARGKHEEDLSQLYCSLELLSAPHRDPIVNSWSEVESYEPEINQQRYQLLLAI